MARLTFEEKIQKAKAVSMRDLYGDLYPLKELGNKLQGRCPFHADNVNPNFFIYTQTNTWNCFKGCGGGDSISFYMRLKNVDFKTALKEMR